MSFLNMRVYLRVMLERRVATERTIRLSKTPLKRYAFYGGSLCALYNFRALWGRISKEAHTQSLIEILCWIREFGHNPYEIFTFSSYYSAPVFSRI